MKLLYLVYVVGCIYGVQIVGMNEDELSKAMHLITRIYFDTIEEVNQELIHARSGLKQPGRDEGTADPLIRDFATRISQFYAYNNCNNTCTKEHGDSIQGLLYDFDKSIMWSPLGKWHFSHERLIKCIKGNVDFDPPKAWNLIIKNRMLRHIEGEEVRTGYSSSHLIEVSAVRYKDDEIKLKLP